MTAVYEFPSQLTLLSDLCDSSPDLNNEEKAAELLPILVQEVYALIRLGQLEEAKKLDSSIAISSYVKTTCSG